MFTGIIEEVGELLSLEQSTDLYQLTIKAQEMSKDLQLGESIAVNGVCLTVTKFSSTQFTVDVMPETLHATNLRAYKKGDKLNLERAMSMQGRFGGHFVSGHVDGTGTIIQRKKVSNAIYFWIEAEPSLLKYILSKGSVAIDGISLTVVDSDEHQFSVSIIPHTLQETILGSKDQGDVVNIECDMIAKYVERLVMGQSASRRSKSLTLEQLADNGFL